MKIKRIKTNSPDSLRTLFKIQFNVIKDVRRYKLYLALIILSSILLSFILVFNSPDIYLTISDFFKLILPYYSISIGFTITSATFLVNSMSKEYTLDTERINAKSSIQNLVDLKNTYINTISTIISYIVFSILLLIMLFIQILIGKYTLLNGWYLLIFNIIYIFSMFTLIFYSFFLFLVIAKAVYLFCVKYIDHTVENVIEKINNK